jgi:ABC-2 type transport system ATP-binding protein
MAKNKQLGHLVTKNDDADHVAIRVDHVSKSFILPHNKQNSIKGGLINIFNGDRSYEKQEVLKDVSFEIKKGEFFGIVGRNGSGKSTLLKMLAGIYTPTKGTIMVNGSLTPFIELGVGFNPELTGRENVFLNGALLGFNRNEMAVMYNDIVEFAELERFMDQKLKNYSSGMQVRLAFSIAIRAQSDILILDEVLAVGDEAFQKKCISVFENYKAAKRTVVLVTHDMGMVERFCNRALLIDSGRINAIGDPEKVALGYAKLNKIKLQETLRDNKSDLSSLVKITLSDTYVKYNDKLILDIDWHKLGLVNNLGVAVYKDSGEYIFGTNTLLDKINIKKIRQLQYNIKIPINNGNYHFKIGFFADDIGKDVVLFIEKGPSFVVDDKKLSWQGLMQLEHQWVIDK